MTETTLAVLVVYGIVFRSYMDVITKSGANPLPGATGLMSDVQVVLFAANAVRWFGWIWGLLAALVLFRFGNAFTWPITFPVFQLTGRPLFGRRHDDIDFSMFRVELGLLYLWPWLLLVQAILTVLAWL